MKIGHLEINETTNLFLMKEDNKNTVQGSALYDLLNVKNAHWLDSNEIVKRVYEEKYDYYKEAKDIMSGDVLNSFRTVFERYIDCVCGKEIFAHKSYEKKDEIYNDLFKRNNERLSRNKKEREIWLDEKDRITISEKANLFFHLMTTIGNVMPWILNGNYPSLGAMDTVNNKLEWFYGVIDDKRTNVKYYAPIKKWKEFIIKKNDNKNFSDWKQAFIDMYYLQDFVEEDGVTPKKELSPTQLSVEDGSWDNFFFEISKAIISRSYRVLNGIKGDFSDNQLKEIKEIFNVLCAEYEIKERW
jgi:hypothetical protein